MTKKLFLMTTLSLISSLQLFGGEHTESRLLNFITQLKNLPSVECKETAQWMERTFVSANEYHQNMTNLLTTIINGNLSVEQKINAITQLKKAEEQKVAETEKRNKRNAFLISMAKISTIGLVTAGALYYCYAARPWTKLIS